MRRTTALGLCAGLLCAVAAAHAATSTGTVASPAGGNGHNVSFDGRLYVVTRGDATGAGWFASVLRPQAVVTTSGLPDMANAFSPFVKVHDDSNHENALALCEASPQPTACDGSGNPSATGDHRCYDLFVIDSDAVEPKPNNVLRRRRLQIVVEQPNTANAAVKSFTWLESALTPLQPTLRGIEPTITKDGRLLVWQGVPGNTGDIDTLVYSYNATACATSGWTAPKSISSMNTDTNVVGKYKLAERPLRAADGTVYNPGALVYGAYPWIFPSGEAVNFTAVNMPCRSVGPPEDPPGCGPRRNALSVLGYVTNWTLAHVDGDVNPATDDTVRLFFSSPGPLGQAPLPVTKGIDVWPFFGSNTSNYTELIFDDALDGNYAGYWHMNELVTQAGAFDLARTADSSGYANTARLKGGASFPAKNNGKTGKAIVFNGSDARLEVSPAASLIPVNQITIEMTVYPTADPNCDGNNNYRVLLGKGSSYSIVLEDDRSFHARVRVQGGAIREVWSHTPLPLNQWSRIAVEYDAANGIFATLLDGTETQRETFAPAQLAGLNDTLTIGGPNGARAACPNGDGAFPGLIDEVSISRVWRYGPLPFVPDLSEPILTDGGVVDVDQGVVVPGGDGGSGQGPKDGGGTGGGDEGGCAMGGSHTRLPALATALVIALLAYRRHRHRT
jgi:hypothetical protein